MMFLAGAGQIVVWFQSFSLLQHAPTFEAPMNLWQGCYIVPPGLGFVAYLTQTLNESLTKSGGNTGSKQCLWE
jgi:hypothetical protein